MLLSTKVVDSLLPLLDAILRTRTITGSLYLIPVSPSPTIANSLAMQWIIGAVSSSGGGQLAATFGVWKPFKDWDFLAKPVFLKGGILATLDVWGGLLAALLYGMLTHSHPSYQPTLSFLASYHVNPEKILGTKTYTRHPAHMKKAEAEMSKAVVTLMLASLYVVRVGIVHWGFRRWPGKGQKLGKDGTKKEAQKTEPEARIKRE